MDVNSGPKVVLDSMYSKTLLKSTLITVSLFFMPNIKNFTGHKKQNFEQNTITSHDSFMHLDYIFNEIESETD